MFTPPVCTHINQEKQNKHIYMLKWVWGRWKGLGKSRGEKKTFYLPKFLAQCNEVSPLHVAPSYEAKNLLCSEHWHSFQVFSIDTIFLENLTITTKIYLFQPQANILKNRSKVHKELVIFHISYILIYITNVWAQAHRC